MRANLSKLIGAVSLSLVLSACSPSATCSNETEAAEYLAKLSADVQSATTSNKLSMDQLKLWTRRARGTPRKKTLPNSARISSKSGKTMG